jgi:hypothetical protein
MNQTRPAPAPGNEIDALLRARLAVPVKEAPKWLAARRSTLYDAIEREDVPAIRIGAVRILAWWLREKLAPPAGGR